MAFSGKKLPNLASSAISIIVTNHENMVKDTDTKTRGNIHVLCKTHRKNTRYTRIAKFRFMYNYSNLDLLCV